MTRLLNSSELGFIVKTLIFFLNFIFLLHPNLLWSLGKNGCTCQSTTVQNDAYPNRKWGYLSMRPTSIAEFCLVKA